MISFSNRMKGLDLLIVDDHEIIRYGLKGIVVDNFPECMVEEADSLETMMAMLQQKEYTHLILDLQLRSVRMLEHFPMLRQRFPDLSIMIHTMVEQTGYAAWLLELGADGFLSKESDPEEAIAALNLFLRFHTYVSPEVARQQAMMRTGRRRYAADPFSRLSPREQELVRLLLTGDTIKQIQNILELKSSTVSTMKNRVFQKLHVSNLIGLVELAHSYHFK